MYIRMVPTTNVLYVPIKMQSITMHHYPGVHREYKKYVLAKLLHYAGWTYMRNLVVDPFRSTTSWPHHFWVADLRLNCNREVKTLEQALVSLYSSLRASRLNTG